MFQFAILSNCGGLAIAFRGRARDAQSRDGAFRQQSAELLADFHQFTQIFHKFPSERIFDDRGGRRAPRRWSDGLAHFTASLFHKRDNFADLGFHRSPSSPLISEAFSPPTRAWTRGPVVITSARRISSARGASFTPTSIASK